MGPILVRLCSGQKRLLLRYLSLYGENLGGSNRRIGEGRLGCLEKAPRCFHLAMSSGQSGFLSGCLTRLFLRLENRHFVFLDKFVIGARRELGVVVAGLSLGFLRFRGRHIGLRLADPPLRIGLGLAYRQAVLLQLLLQHSDSVASLADLRTRLPQCGFGLLLASTNLIVVQAGYDLAGLDRISLANRDFAYPSAGFTGHGGIVCFDAPTEENDVGGRRRLAEDRSPQHQRHRNQPQNDKGSEPPARLPRNGIGWLARRLRANLRINAHRRQH